MPSSIPSPARRIGTTSGRGSPICTPMVLRHGGRDLDRLHPDASRRLVCEQGHQLLGQLAEDRRRRPLVAQHRELVGDQGVSPRRVHAYAQANGWRVADDRRMPRAGVAAAGVAWSHDGTRIRPHRDRRRCGGRERRRPRRAGRALGGDRRERAGRRRVLVLGVHALQGAAAERGGPAGRARGRRGPPGDHGRARCRGRAAAAQQDHPRVGRRVAGEVARQGRHRARAGPRRVHRGARSSR